MRPRSTSSPATGLKFGVIDCGRVNLVEMKIRGESQGRFASHESRESNLSPSSPEQNRLPSRRVLRKDTLLYMWVANLEFVRPILHSAAKNQ